jgi:hypothetical protein
VQVDQGLRAFMLGVYNNMIIGLAQADDHVVVDAEHERAQALIDLHLALGVAGRAAGSAPRGTGCRHDATSVRGSRESLAPHSSTLESFRRTGICGAPAGCTRA